ncbi:mechanosensitive ion channel protein 1, mitochondrial isoform X1 [Quercus lobata]|uniref:mechanosensitive ion channel protein 1, mitochondrial isoform X1 n=1 Tax=Quercus lobata TaxID=97700 RepID=UPI001243A6CF|nr:mechanosensitive ion channel protein 1, mitochondrial isoform X1 [Quercus lobata]
MAGVRVTLLRLLRNSANPFSKMQSFRSYNNSDMRISSPLQAFVKESQSPETLTNTHFKTLGSQSLLYTQCYKTKPITAFSPTLSNLHLLHNSPLILISPFSNYRSYSWSSGSKADKAGVPTASGASGVDGSGNDVFGSDFVDKVKDAWQTAVDAGTYTVQKAKEASDELIPYAHQLLDSHPYLKDVIIPFGGTFAGTILAWSVMPRLLRRFHKYATQSPAASPTGSVSWEQVPYERTIWGALEDPVRYLITFMAFSQMVVMVAPTTMASQYLGQAWRGAVILSFVWFLHRWKSNVFTRMLATQSAVGIDRDKLLAFDNLSSVGLFVIGIMALAEACGVAVQSVLTVGGIGGVATAFAARDILGNVLSGLALQFSKPFSLGDKIKAGNVEGQVVDMGLTTTSLLNAEKFPVIVPNSLFSSQVIVNKSRAQWRAMVTKIPLQVDDLDKIPLITNDVKSMLRLNSKVFLGMEAPYCFLSRIESSFAELTLGCNLKHMSKDELHSTEQDLLLQSVQIIKKHGARLGSTWQDTTSQ